MSRFLFVIVLILIGGIVVLGILVRSQNLTIAALSESVASLSTNVYDIVKQKGTELRRTGEMAATKMSNPASQNCSGVGGKLSIEKRPDGGEYGICSFGANMECEEWALMRGECAQGGADVSMTSNAADRFCIITGHELIKPGDTEKAGLCRIDNKECSAQEYFDTGECKYSVVE
ncbi:MAG: DUF333 domain-containing protein [Patescibacteria group bacterium]|nr:DUF333 domain-containing protein [Patescibacteria group bacterium]